MLTTTTIDVDDREEKQFWTEYTDWTQSYELYTVHDIYTWLATMNFDALLFWSWQQEKIDKKLLIIVHVIQLENTEYLLKKSMRGQKKQQRFKKLLLSFAEFSINLIGKKRNLNTSVVVFDFEHIMYAIPKTCLLHIGPEGPHDPKEEEVM